MEKLALKNLFCSNLRKYRKGKGCFVSGENLHDPVKHFFNERREVSRNFLKQNRNARITKNTKSGTLAEFSLSLQFKKWLAVSSMAFLKRENNSSISDSLMIKGGQQALISPGRGRRMRSCCRACATRWAPFFLGRIKKTPFSFFIANEFDRTDQP